MTDINQVSKQLLYKYEPKQEWLKHDSYWHGVGHMTRVFILQELICNQLDEELDRDAIRWAASVHDVGRIDDGIDLDHGRRSAEWMKDNQPSFISPETLDTATYIVHWHVDEDSDIPVMTNEMKVLKDADGLDRVRLGDLDETYLRTRPARQLIETAQALYDMSQPTKSNERDSFKSVLEAATQIGIVA